MLIDCDPGQAETLRTCLLSELGLRDVDYIHDNAAFEHLGHTSLPGIPSRGALTSVPQVVTVGYAATLLKLTGRVMNGDMILDDT